jgi:hypothetical protein
MMGRLNHDQGRLFYSFCLEEVVPDDHLVRKVAAVLDLSWVHAELAPRYPDKGSALDRSRADDPHANHWLCELASKKSSLPAPSGPKSRLSRFCANWRCSASPTSARSCAGDQS